MFWKKSNYVKPPSPEEFFADCDGDVIKMIEKVENMWDNGATLSQFLYLQKKILQSYKENLGKTS